MRALIVLDQNSPGKHSFTFDIWATDEGDPYLSLTNHRVTIDPKNSQNWKLESDQIGFEHIPASHTGKNIAEVVVRVIDRYGIKHRQVRLCLYYFKLLSDHSITRQQIGWFTVDNASNNDTAIKAIGQKLKLSVKEFDPKERRIRYVFRLILMCGHPIDVTFRSCMEHGLHLGAQHFVSASAPAPGRAILKRVQEVLDRTMSDDEELDIDQLNDELAALGFDGESDPIPEGEEAAVAFKATDTIGKAMALIKQVR